MSVRTTLFALFLAALAVGANAAAPQPAAAPTPESGYDQPPKNILGVMRAPSIRPCPASCTIGSAHLDR